ncbi:MAG: hypothetical protein RL459_210 [Pseudomonadota bacterium]|jgi:exodeoxyribonuclease VII small subunit
MPKASAKPVDTPIASSFEAAQDELDRLVSRMEAGDLPLDQLLSAYQRGAQLLQFCRDRLEAVDQQIKLLDAGHLKNWTPE